MSQQGQAENQNEAGRQSFNEWRTAATTLRARRDSGELSEEAFQAELDQLTARTGEYRERFRRAAELNTLERDALGLAALAQRPAPVRPQVDPAAIGGGGDEGGADRTQPAAELEVFERPPGLDALGARARTLLNRYLRPHDGGRRGVEECYGQDQWSWLTSPRQPSRAELTARRGDQFALNPYVDRAGGWVQAEEIANEVVALRSDATDLMGQVDTRTITGARLTLHTRNVTVSFTKRGRGDGAAVTVYDLSDVFGRTAVTPFAKDLIIQVPEEYFEDPLFDAVGAITEGIEEESREDDETQLLHGTGSGEALGIVTGLKKLYAEGYTAVGVDIAGSGGNIAPADVQAFPHKLKANARRNAVWIGPRVFFERVALFRSEEGGAGTGRFMYSEPLAAGMPPTLKGKPVFESEFMEDKITSGSAGDVMVLLGNPLDYLWVIQKGLQLRILAELYAEKNMIGYKYVKKSDGCLQRGDGFIYMRRTA